MGSKNQNQSKCKLKNSWQPKVGKHQEISKPLVKVMEQHDFMKGCGTTQVNTTLKCVLFHFGFH